MKRSMEHFINTSISLVIGFTIGLSDTSLLIKEIVLVIILLTASAMARGTIHDALQEAEKK